MKYAVLVLFMALCSINWAQDSTTVANLQFDSKFKGVKVIKLVENPSGMELKNMGEKATQVKYICFHESGHIIEDFQLEERQSIAILRKDERTLHQGILHRSQQVPGRGERLYLDPQETWLREDERRRSVCSQKNLVYYIEVLVKNPSQEIVKCVVSNLI